MLSVWEVFLLFCTSCSLRNDVINSFIYFSFMIISHFFLTAGYHCEDWTHHHVHSNILDFSEMYKMLQFSLERFWGPTRHILEVKDRHAVYRWSLVVQCLRYVPSSDPVLFIKGTECFTARKTHISDLQLLYEPSRTSEVVSFQSKLNTERQRSVLLWLISGTNCRSAPAHLC